MIPLSLFAVPVAITSKVIVWRNMASQTVMVGWLGCRPRELANTATYTEINDGD